MNYEIIEGQFSNIETILAEKRPVVVGLKLFTNYTNYINNFILKPDDHREKELLHAVTIIGIKEINDQDYYEIMDSRGSEIGDSGFWWISAEELEERLIFGFDFQLSFPKTKSLDTYWEFTSPKDTIALNLASIYNEQEQCFVIQKSSWKENINFRTYISNLHKGNFIYMLYYSASEQPHYDHFEIGQVRSKKVTFEKQRFYFPDKKQEKDGFSKTDTDYMLFLYTYESIDIESVLENLKKCNDNSSVYNCLKTVFEDQLITDVSYQYNPETYQISCHVTDVPTSYICGTVIPLIIKFE